METKPGALTVAWRSLRKHGSKVLEALANAEDTAGVPTHADGSSRLKLKPDGSSLPTPPLNDDELEGFSTLRRSSSLKRLPLPEYSSPQKENRATNGSPSVGVRSHMPTTSPEARAPFSDTGNTDLAYFDGASPSSGPRSPSKSASSPGKTSSLRRSLRSLRGSLGSFRGRSPKKLDADVPVDPADVAEPEPVPHSSPIAVPLAVVQQGADQGFLASFLGEVNKLTRSPVEPPPEPLQHNSNRLQKLSSRRPFVPHHISTTSANAVFEPPATTDKATLNQQVTTPPPGQVFQLEDVFSPISEVVLSPFDGTSELPSTNELAKQVSITDPGEVLEKFVSTDSPKTVGGLRGDGVFREPPSHAPSITWFQGHRYLLKSDDTMDSTNEPNSLSNLTTAPASPLTQSAQAQLMALLLKIERHRLEADKLFALHGQQPPNFMAVNLGDIFLSVQRPEAAVSLKEISEWREEQERQENEPDQPAHWRIQLRPEGSVDNSPPINSEHAPKDEEKICCNSMDVEEDDDGMFDSEPETYFDEKTGMTMSRKYMGRYFDKAGLWVEDFEPCVALEAVVARSVIAYRAERTPPDADYTVMNAHFVKELELVAQAVAILEVELQNHLHYTASSGDKKAKTLIDQPHHWEFPDPNALTLDNALDHVVWHIDEISKGTKALEFPKLFDKNGDWLAIGQPKWEVGRLLSPHWDEYFTEMGNFDVYYGDSRDEWPGFASWCRMCDKTEEDHVESQEADEGMGADEDAESTLELPPLPVMMGAW